jgi:hypothetical protein
VPALEILHDFGQFFGNRICVERQDAIDDVICPRLVGGIQIARLRRRLEWTDHHAGGIGAQGGTLLIQGEGSDKNPSR